MVKGYREKGQDRGAILAFLEGEYKYLIRMRLQFKGNCNTSLSFIIQNLQKSNPFPEIV
ncbi:hypothetical protein [Enterocloster sp.]|uniref:hypothetical protein n=1 Tax=Enterocloster sp. TaxID=2719315 RepID=UPI0039A26CF9